MTLSQTWKNCLRMWKWIDKVWKPGMNIDSLKQAWLEKWMPDVIVQVDCFFCEYADEHYDHRYRFCSQCPGRLVGKRFNCRNAAYSYREKPKEFYQKLLYLDVKRRQK